MTTASGEIWVTGSRGFIGRHTVAALRRGGAVVRAFSPHGEGDVHPLNFSSAPDIRRAVESFGLPRAFVHLGWGAMTDPGSDEHLGANAAAARCLMDTLGALGLPRFVFIGSANEYGARTGALTEDLEPEGRMTNYGQAKYETTRYGLAQKRPAGQYFICVRPFYVYGPGQRPGSLLNKLFLCHAENRVADLGPCEHFRDYVYVEDVAEGIRRACDVNSTTVLNVGSGRVVRVREFVELFWRLLGGAPDRLQIGANAMRAGEPEQPWAFADLTRLRQATGWAPTRSLEEGLARTIECLREAQHVGR